MPIKQNRPFIAEAHFSCNIVSVRSSLQEAFLGKDVLKKYGKFTRENQFRSVISIKMQSNYINITLRHGCSLINLLDIFRTPFPKNTPGGLLLFCYVLKPNNMSVQFLFNFAYGSFLDYSKMLKSIFNCTIKFISKYDITCKNNSFIA